MAKFINRASSKYDFIRRKFGKHGEKPKAIYIIMRKEHNINTREIKGQCIIKYLNVSSLNLTEGSIYGAKAMNTMSTTISQA